MSCRFILPALIVSCLSIAGALLLLALSLQTQQVMTLRKTSARITNMTRTHLCPFDLGGPDALLLGDCLLTRSSQCSTKCRKAGEPLSSMFSAPRACICKVSRLLFSRRDFARGWSPGCDVSRTVLLFQSWTNRLAAQRWRHVSSACIFLLRSFAVWLRVLCLCADLHTRIDCTSASEVASHAHQTS